MRFTWTSASALLLLCTGVSSFKPDATTILIKAKRELDSGIANIHLEYSREVDVAHFYTYGPCYSSDPTKKSHHVVARQEQGSTPERLVWVIPKNAKSGDCLAAWTAEGKALLGRSEPVKIQPNAQMRRRSDPSISMSKENGIDVEGAWFDGVALLESKGSHGFNATEVKQKKIAIVGAGMSGLMTYLNLHESGFTNIELIESSERLGGRVYTDYIEGGPFDYQYQEIGAMRIPKNVTYSETQETFPYNDQKFVFQVADALNEMNKERPELKVDFIPFIQDSPNGLYYYNGIRKHDGTVPTISEAFSNDSLNIPSISYPELDEVMRRIKEVIADPETSKQMAVNMRKAHQEFQDTGVYGLGGDHWSEFAFIHNYLRATLNTTDLALDALPGHGAESFFNDMMEHMLFYNTDTWQTQWVTVDGGFSRLPEAFGPLVSKDLKKNRAIEKIEYLPEGDGQVKLSWKEKFTDSKFKDQTYDYAVVSAPFSVVRRWRLPRFSPTLTNAIAHLPYAGGCKVALQYSSRFWEKLEKPIYGSQGTLTDLPGIGSVVYPSFAINSTGPAAILASYVYGDKTQPWLALSEEETVQYVVDAMVEIHGEVAREQYTGKYSRKCWDLDPNQSGAWAQPTIGQQKLYLPAYYKTENNVIFVGEHTSYVHAWVSAAIESGVRGSVQLLLELGLVDEAKDVTKRWMSRWMNV